MLWISLALGQPVWFAYEQVTDGGDIRQGRCTLQPDRLSCSTGADIVYDSGRGLLAGVDPILGSAGGGPTFAWAFIPIDLDVGAEVQIRDRTCTVDPPGGEDRVAAVPQSAREVRCSGLLSWTKNGEQYAGGRTELWYYDAATGFILAYSAWNVEASPQPDRWNDGKVVEGFRITSSSYAEGVRAFLGEKRAESVAERAFPAPKPEVNPGSPGVGVVGTMVVGGSAYTGLIVGLILLNKYTPASWWQKRKPRDWDEHILPLPKTRPIARTERPLSADEAQTLCQALAPELTPILSLVLHNSQAVLTAHAFGAGDELLTVMPAGSGEALFIAKERLVLDAMGAVVGKRNTWSTLAPSLKTTAYTVMRRLPQEFSPGPHVTEPRAGARDDLLWLASKHDLRVEVERLLDGDHPCLMSRQGGLSLGFVAIQDRVALVHTVISDAQSGNDAEAALDALRELVGALARRAEQRGAREVYIVVREPHGEAFRGVSFQPMLKLHFGGEAVPPLFARAGVV